MNKKLFVCVLMLCIGALLIIINWFVDIIWLHRIGHVALLVGIVFLPKTANSAHKKQSKRNRDCLPLNSEMLDNDSSTSAN